MVHPLDSRPSAFWKLNALTNKRRLSKSENRTLTRSVAAAVIAFFLMAFGAMMGSRYQMAQHSNAVPGVITGTVRIPMTVQPGDSLWSLAQRYGDPKAYILDRVDVLARANQMQSTSSLMPGQRIVIPVSNPGEISRLQRNLAKN
jgi:hypothetical protein